MGEAGKGTQDPQQAAKELRALRDKAQRLSDALRDVADWLGMASTTKDFDPDASFWAKSNGSYANIKQDEAQYREALNYDELVQLAGQIVAARKAAGGQAVLELGYPASLPPSRPSRSPLQVRMH